MDRDELVHKYWEAYKLASLRRGSCDIGDLEQVDAWERDAIADALETVIQETTNANEN